MLWEFCISRRQLINSFIMQIGPHLPKYITVAIKDKIFTYKDHPELCCILPPDTACLECWNPSGQFYPFNCYQHLDISCRPSMIILRPQDQPANYLSNCIGFRELTYKQYWSPGRYRWTTVLKGITPLDTTLSLYKMDCLEHLKETDDWKSGSWDFRDRSMARDDGEWEGDQDDYDSNDYKFIVIKGSLVIFNHFNWPMSYSTQSLW